MANPFVRVGGFFGRFFGNTISESAAYGIGGALREPLHPLLQELTNKTWQAGTVAGVSKPLDLAMAAEVAAELVGKYDDMETQASFSGYDAGHFKDAYGVTLVAPGVGELLAMLRRNDEEPIDFAHGLRKAKLESDWDKALRNLRDVRIPAPDLAYMVVRDLVPNPFGGSGPTSATDTTISDISQLDIDTLKEAARTGWDPTRFEALVGRSGLAPAPILAANAFFRGIITWPEYKTIIAKGDLRPAYTNVILNAARQILTAGEYSEAELRGYTDAKTRRANTAKHGMSVKDSDLLHLIQGRPLAVHQVTTGLARGGKHGGLYSDVPQPYQDAIRQSNIKEPWAGLAFANRYTYPSGFQIKSEAPTDGYDFVHGLLLEVGWKPELAAHYAAKWAGAAGPGAKADPHVAKAQTQLWTTLHRSYLAGESTAAEITAALPRAGVSSAAVADVLATWDEERTIIRKQLSPAQVKKAYVEGVLNLDTGAAWTKDEATAALVARGYSTADATTFLEL